MVDEHPQTPTLTLTGGKNDLFPEFAISWLAVSRIDAAPRRVRRASKSQEASVLRAIERFGFRIPLLVRQKTGSSSRYEVIDGHTRLSVARQLGAEKVPCILVDDLPDLEIRRLALSLNKLQETGEWDSDALRVEIREIIEINGDIEIPGFSVPEIEAIQFGAGEDAVADSADDVSDHLADPERTVVSQTGDVWILGDHTVCCGNARDGEAATNVLQGGQIDVIFTDPPYNVPINGHVRSADGGYQEFAEASGEMSRVEFVAFLVETLGNASKGLRPGGILFGCIDWRHIGEISEALEVMDLELLNICVWVKSNPGMGSLYRSQHEFVCVARKPGAAHLNNVQLGKFGRNRSNVWSYAGATGGQSDVADDFAAHPTVKPIRLVMDALLDVSEPGDRVLDVFLGSGTTLLAAERTGRRCIGIEVEPAYVDIAIRRWQAMTGRHAIHAESGLTFDAALSAKEVTCGADEPHSEPPSATAQDAGLPDVEAF